MSIAIRVEQISKQYRLGVVGYGLFFKDLQSWVARKLGRPDPHGKIWDEQFEAKEGKFWALKDVSFDVERGARVGIIGRNGAGKSTLLKILSRITAPTEGRIGVKGRVASLLEVGTGFHPELTGKENVYLNGAILGMKKREVDRKFDEIIDFAGIERFVNTPVKRYSSGMYVRLAFSVAAHLDSEILLADEVLAVGDAEFQKKCISKMEDVSKGEGRTILFVSHNMGFIEALCSQVLLFDKGRLVEYGANARKTIQKYLGNSEQGLTSCWTRENGSPSSAEFTPTRFAVTTPDDKIVDCSVSHEDNVFVHIEGFIRTLNPLLTVGYALYTEEGYLLYWSYHTDEPPDKWPTLKPGNVHIKSRIPIEVLNEGTYELRLISGIHYQYWITDPDGKVPTIFFSVQGGFSRSPYWLTKRPGLLAPTCRWDSSEISGLVSTSERQ